MLAAPTAAELVGAVLAAVASWLSFAASAASTCPFASSTSTSVGFGATATSTAFIAAFIAFAFSNAAPFRFTGPRGLGSSRQGIKKATGVGTMTVLRIVGKVRLVRRGYLSTESRAERSSFRSHLVVFGAEIKVVEAA